MAKQGKNRAAVAARGTAKDPNKRTAAYGSAGASAGKAAGALARNGVGMTPRNLGTKREKLTKRILTVVQVVLVAFPFIVYGYAGLGGGDFREILSSNPGFTVSFLAAVAQPFVAWLLRFVHRHYAEGDGGYALANLMVLVCGELLLQNALGIAGCVVLLWRFWKTTRGELAAWRARRKVGGMLADVSGALVVVLFGVICAFANWRLSLAG